MAKLLCYFPALIAILWTKHMESVGYRNGMSLTDVQKEFFATLKIRNIEKVRVYYVPRIAHPLDFIFKWIAPFTAKVISSPIGLTLGYTIFIRSKYHNDLSLLAHEMVHVRQYENYNGHLKFLTNYIYECWKYGYAQAPLEQEAVEVSHILMNNLSKNRNLA